MSEVTVHIPEVDYTAADALMRELIVKVQAYMQRATPEDIEKTLWDTYVFARTAHHGQMRKSGEPYITHPVLACSYLLHLKPDLVSLQSCILHDVIEDTEYKRDAISKRFWEEVASICEWLSKLSAIRYRGEERTIESLRKMLVAMVEDLRVIIVKLADRLHNMTTLDHHPDPKKRERIALETLNIYAPIADRLGIFRMKEMLETECFRILHPEEYRAVTAELDAMRDEQEYFVHEAKAIIRKMIPDSTPIIDISYRIKAPYSIYKKLQRKEYSYSHARDLYDLFAIRVITENIPRCYEVLGVLHNVFVPMPKRFKDYIALPKENGYQSLHTTVVGLFPEVRSQPTEIQVRTPEMHIQAEIWVAAHFDYAESWESSKSKDSYWVATIKKIVENELEGWEFMKEMNMSVFSDQIFVFTPKGDIITLPKGATPIDFAYAVHTRVGNELTIAKVNGQVVPLDYTLHNGESIHIVTDSHRKPNPIWLSFVKTAKAREHIRHFINREERGFFIEKWRFILNAYLEKNYGRGLDKELSLLKNIDGKTLDTKKKEDVLVQLGNLSRKPGSILKWLHDTTLKAQLETERILREDQAKSWRTKRLSPDKKLLPDELVIVPIIGKERDIPHKLAQCCSPEAGQKIVWVIGKSIITLHRFDCENMDRVTLSRRIPAHWSNAKIEGIRISMDLVFLDRRGLLRQLTDIFYQAGLDIESLSTENRSEGRVIDRFVLHSDEEDYYLYERLIERLKFDIPEFIEGKLVSIS
jgi:GTP diphosphokinase / guanosine-3',5'-bis(diphosphate) 3'-diphosphatase